MSLLSSDYRTGVINDFSIVSKAVFHVLTLASSSPLSKTPKTFKLDSDGILPVQINPNEIEIKYSDGRVDSLGGIKDDEEDSWSSRMPRGDTRSLDLKLEYSLYDEYNMRTMEGLLPPTKDICLTSTATSLKRLSEIAGSTKKYVHFYWGEFSFLGLLSKFEVKYTQFSRWGEPLRGSADVTITEEPLGWKDAANDKRHTPMDAIDTTGTLKIKAYHKADDALNTVALAAVQASR